MNLLSGNGTFSEEFLMSSLKKSQIQFTIRMKMSSLQKFD